MHAKKYPIVTLRLLQCRLQFLLTFGQLPCLPRRGVNVGIGCFLFSPQAATGRGHGPWCGAAEDQGCRRPKSLWHSRRHRKDARASVGERKGEERDDWTTDVSASVQPTHGFTLEGRKDGRKEGGKEGRKKGRKQGNKERE